MINAYYILILFLLAKNANTQESIAFIDEGPAENPPKEQIQDLPPIETIEHHGTQASRFWRTLAISFPFFIFLINQVWSWTSPDLPRIWSNLHANRIKEILGLNPEQEIQFKSVDLSHHVALLQSNSVIQYFKIEIETLYRQDIFYALWNKIHNNYDRIEFTAILRSKEPFSLFLGRRSALINSTDLVNLKNVCNDYSISNLSHNFTCLTELPNPLEIISPKFIDSVKAKHAHFNYFYVTDLVNCNFHVPMSDLNVQDYLVVKMSLILTSSKFWGYELNNLDDIVDEFFVVVRNILAIRLSSPVKSAIDRSRQKLLEVKSKEEHLKRQEIAMKKKDEKVRAMKEKIMSEADEKKQIKLQEKFERYEAKEKNKKMTKGKSIKVIS